MLELLGELNRDEGHTIVIVTHDPERRRDRRSGSSSCATARVERSRGSRGRLGSRVEPMDRRRVGRRGPTRGVRRLADASLRARFRQLRARRLRAAADRRRDRARRRDDLRRPAARRRRSSAPSPTSSTRSTAAPTSSSRAAQSTGSLPLRQRSSRATARTRGRRRARAPTSLDRAPLIGDGRRGPGAAAARRRSTSPASTRRAATSATPRRSTAATIRGGREIALEESWADANGIEVGDQAAARGAVRRRSSSRSSGCSSSRAVSTSAARASRRCRSASPARPSTSRDVYDEIEVIVAGGERQIDVGAAAARAEFGKGVEVETPDAKGEEVE